MCCTRSLHHGQYCNCFFTAEKRKLLLIELTLLRITFSFNLHLQFALTKKNQYGLRVYIYRILRARTIMRLMPNHSIYPSKKATRVSAIFSYSKDKIKSGNDRQLHLVSFRCSSSSLNYLCLPDDYHAQLKLHPRSYT